MRVRCALCWCVSLRRAPARALTAASPARSPFLDACAAWCTRGRYVDLQGSSAFERRRSASIRLAFHLLLLASSALQLPQQVDHLRFGFDTRLGFGLHMLGDEFFLISVSLVVLQWALLSTEVLGQRFRGHVYTLFFVGPNALLLTYVIGMIVVLLYPSAEANDGDPLRACGVSSECECNAFLDFIDEYPYKVYQVVVNVLQGFIVILLFGFGILIQVCVFMYRYILNEFC